MSKNKREHALPLFRELNILPLDELIKSRRASYLWKLKNNLLPPTLASWFRKNNSEITNRINTDLVTQLNTVIYHLPQPRLEYAKRHITYTGVLLWNNDIPNDLKQSTSAKIFKKKFYKHLTS